MRLWRCCPAAATFPTCPPVSASTCTPWTGRAGWLPWAGTSTRTARCCLCDSLWQKKKNKKLPWLSVFIGASSRTQTCTSTGPCLSERSPLSAPWEQNRLRDWYSEGGQNKWKTLQHTAMQSNPILLKKCLFSWWIDSSLFETILLWHFIELHSIIRCSCCYCPSHFSRTIRQQSEYSVSFIYVICLDQ